ncbi:MAG TPA: hypothetical protein VEU29_04510, partial [Actinomycetota bacterium]|nr:hypothetical protein [Actinomycetota bacterium]
MNDVENALSRLLVERSEKVAPDPGHRERTLGRARRRRLTNAVTAGVASLAIVAGGIGGVRALEPREARPAADRSDGTAAPAGEYGFWSWAGAEYPYVATGFFRSAEWELRAAAVSFEPDAHTRLTLQVRLRGSEVGASTGLRTLDGLFVTYHPAGEWAYGGDFGMVFGAAPT